MYISTGNLLPGDVCSNQAMVPVLARDTRPRRKDVGMRIPNEVIKESISRVVYSVSGGAPLVPAPLVDPERDDLTNRLIRAGFKMDLIGPMSTDDLRFMCRGVGEK
jgi:hypothetical protein